MKKYFNIIFTISLLYLSGSFSVYSNEPSIKISGEIDKNFRLKFLVKYAATKKSIWCQDYVLLAGIWIREMENYFYEVENEDGKYSIKIPLNEKKKDAYCGWRPVSISYNINHNGFPDLENTSYGGLVSVWDTNYKPATVKVLSCSAITREYNQGEYLRCMIQGDVSELSTAIVEGQSDLTVHFYINKQNKQGE